MEKTSELSLQEKLEALASLLKEAIPHKQGGVCPNCGSANVHVDARTAMPKRQEQLSVRCLICKKMWTTIINVGRSNCD